MLRKSWLLAILLGLLVAFPAQAEKSGATNDFAGLSPREILDRVDDLFRGRSSRGQMTMTIQTPHWRRTLSLEFWSEGKEKSLLRILAPQKEKGTATLKVDRDLWNYLPKVKRVIKLPSSMMSASWMGSHFSNDDLVKESRFADDFTFEKTYEGKRADRTVIEITCVPKPDAAVVWGKVVVRVDHQTFMPIQTEYFDESGKLARLMTFTQYRDFGSRHLPAVLILRPVNQAGEFTEVKYTEIIFDMTHPQNLFSLRTLQE